MLPGSGSPSGMRTSSSRQRDTGRKAAMSRLALQDPSRCSTPLAIVRRASAPGLTSRPQASPFFREQVVRARQHLARGGDVRRRQALAEILLEGLDDFGLRPIALDDDGARLFDAGQRLIDDVLADAARQRVGLDAGKELDKGG